jgi:hypothetical protein
MSSIIKVDTIQDQDGNNIINENANTITIGASGDTISIPSGATLANSGTATGFGISWQSDIKTSAFTAVAGEGYFCNTTSSAFTITLPGSASAGDTIQIVDYAGTFATNNITLTSSLNIEGEALNKVLTTNREGVTITYADATQGWVASSGVNSGNQALDPDVYSADFLVVAGGGGGGNGGFRGGGGGGAGGYRTSTQSIEKGRVITVTVGDGGVGLNVASSQTPSGSNSSISGTGITTITSAGGGGGGNESGGFPGVAGGSGGGGAGTTGAGSTSGGAGNTPSTDPSQGNDGGAGIGSPSNDTLAGGGGGGAAAVGQASSLSNGGNGGNGSASSITGSSVTYAGGGGGAVKNGTSGSGGSGGGGAGVSTGVGTAGTINTGGGAGGTGNNGGSGRGGTGGKGVVIISVPDADYSGTTTGSPTVVTGVSGKTVMTFTGSGSYTA